jgi:transmembrane sensor
MDKAYITNLLLRYFTNEATHAEREALFAELEKYKNNEDWVEIHTSLLAQAEEIKEYDPEHYQAIIDKVLKGGGHKVPIAIGNKGDTKNTKIIPLYRIYRRAAFKWIAAACIIGVMSYGLWVMSEKKQPVSTAQTQTDRYKNDINPGGFKARLTLADGSVIILDSAAEGQLAAQGQTAVINKDGQLVYQSEKRVASGELIYNTLSTAKGETYSVTLSDGTKVWLNSASSLRYPASFASSAVRQVEITGEAFFEVKHNAAKPFKVLVNGMEVEDLGTEFNINAYTDEPETRTTLISGLAKVTPMSPAGGGDLGKTPNYKRPGVDLKPGQQSVFNPPNPVIRVLKNVNLDEVTAWKDNRFYFRSTDIRSLMRQLSRWYDVDVVYEDVPTTGFNARISRQTPVSSILKALELTGEVKFRIEGRKITVLR